MKRTLLMLAMPVLIAACEIGPRDDDAAREAAEIWASAYFNCDFHTAADYATAESGKWLRFAASNTSESDLQVLQDAGGAGVSVSDYFPVANDTLRVVELTVSRFLAPVAIGEPPHLDDEASFHVTVVLRDNRWKVRMEGLPRNEKQSRD